MNEVEFAALVQRAMEGLRLQTAAHASGWGLGEYDRWDLNQDNGQLVFTDPERGRAVAPAQIIGSWVSHESSWLWAWANPSIHEPLQQDSLRVRAYGEMNGLSELIEPELTISELRAWELTALAVHLCEAQGAYRGPAGDSFVFISFGPVQLSNSNRA